MGNQIQTLHKTHLKILMIELTNSVLMVFEWVKNRAAAQGLSVSLMERIVQLHGESVTVMLTTQYR